VTTQSQSTSLYCVKEEINITEITTCECAVMICSIAATHVVVCDIRISSTAATHVAKWAIRICSTAAKQVADCRIAGPLFYSIAEMYICCQTANKSNINSITPTLKEAEPAAYSTTD
jgi:hypothetical protein